MNTRFSARGAISGLILVTLMAGSALAEIPDTFSNLEVFPQDIGKRKLMGAMRDFSTALGVKCTYCHVQKTPGDFDSIDWASDDLKPKQVSRGMMKMVKNINSELMPAATGEKVNDVRCITCHRGLDNPKPLDKVMLDTIQQDGIEVGLARYRELRDEYYGSGSYDFSPTVLTGVAEALAQGRGDMEGAGKVLDLGMEMNPEDAVTYLMKAQIQIFTGEREGAIANLEKVLELDPGNEQALKLLQQIKPE